MSKKGPGQDQDQKKAHARTPGRPHQDAKRDQAGIGRQDQKNARTATPGRKKRRPIRPPLYDRLFSH
jgi:hypothetical protein